MRGQNMNPAQPANHQQLEIWLADYRDLRGAERAAVDEHLQTCATCAARLADYRAMDRDLADLRDARPDARLRTGYLAAVQGQAGVATVSSVPARRLPWLPGIAAAAAVLALVFGVLFVLRPGEPEPARGAAGPQDIPAAQSAEVGTFIWQTDGAYGYQMLLPAGWVMAEMGEMRAYLNSPAKLGLHVVNLISFPSFQSGDGGMGDMADRFERTPDLAGWATSVEEMWRQHYSPPLTRVAEEPDAVVYMQPFDPPTSQGVTLFALKVQDGQPLVLGLGADGSIYTGIETLQERGIWDDFLTMLASLRPIPTDLANVVPPFPTVDPNRTAEPTHEPVAVATEAVTPTPAPTGEPVVAPEGKTPTITPAMPTPTPGGPRNSETTEVTLDIYSGLPNPVWTLSAAETQVLREMLDALPEVACAPLELNLGYRGFVVLFGQPPELSNEYRLRVYGRQVRWGDPWTPDAPALCHSDVEATVARFLLAGGQPHLAPEVYELVGAEITAAAAVLGDWLGYTDGTLGFSLAHPQTWELTQETGQSRLFSVKVSEPTGPTFPVFYITVIPEGFTNETVEAYNFWNAEEVAAARALEPGASGAVHGAPEYNVFTRLRDVTVDGKPGIVVENERVWEGLEGTRDRRVLVVRGDTTYMLGTYYTTPEELQVFEQVLASFQFVPDAAAGVS